jgi:mono/diheme cytochrome c family protein
MMESVFREKVVGAGSSSDSFAEESGKEDRFGPPVTNFGGSSRSSLPSQLPHDLLQRFSLRKCAATTLAALTVSSFAFGTDEAVDLDRLFTLKVKPMLMEKCLGCHGDPAKKVKGDFLVTTREAFIRGGESFDDVLIPGNADHSFIMEAVRWEDPDYEMPPKENDRLSEQQIADLETWINAGAPWPDDATQKAIRVAERDVEINEEGMLFKTSGGLIDEWTYRRYQPEDMWGFMPVEKPDVPNSEGIINPVDAFVGAKLETAGFEPAPMADAKKLIRRATFGLIGLPPTPEEVEAFVAAAERDFDQAWAELIDRLLDSPHYGERWGQHWLDVARYADTGGLSNDYERSNAWRYRDYVIRSFNEDKPYNQFIVEQVAGDELADASVRERLNNDVEAVRSIHDSGEYNEQEIEWMIASSFLRMGPWDSAMIPKDEARQIYIDDVVNSVGQTFLATTMRCVKCHDHKFDPIPTKDYYRMYAAFAGTQLAERPTAFHPQENLNGLEEGAAMVERLHSFAVQKKEELYDKRETAARKWYKENNREYVDHATRKDMPDDVKPPRHVGLDYIEQGRLKVREQDDWVWERRKERYQPMVQSVYNGPAPKSFNARKLRIVGPEKLEDSLENHILTGGALTALGDKVEPGVLSAVGVPLGDGIEDPYVIPGDDIDGRRTAVARWIADPRNSLTTRSFVNRVWQHHFGKPIAGNPNNFGAKGGKPTHPELLDWLAAEFVEGGWKIKRLHRMIMLSDSYRQATLHPERERLATVDPNNELLAFHTPRRLTAEELRDGMLKITGELNPEMGGMFIQPEINMEVALQPRMIQFSIAPAYQPSPSPEQRNRRSIYAYRVRGQADPFLEIFNQPNPNDSCEMRDAPSVSPQAFTMLNSDLITDRSIAFADRLMSDKDTFEERVVRAFELALGRKPDDEEKTRSLAYVEEMRTYHKKNDPDPVTYPTSVTRSLVEEFSGLPFEFEEILPVFEDYTPDKKATDVDTDTRALADLCLVLFNSNEFVHVY